MEKPHKKLRAWQLGMEFLNFLHISLGSLSELDTQLQPANEFGYIGEDSWKQMDRKLTEEDKVLTGLIKSRKGARSRE